MGGLGEQASDGVGHPSHQQQRTAPVWCYVLLLAAVCSVASAGVAFKWIGDVPPITLASWRLQITTLILAVASTIQWQAMSADDKARFFKDYKWTLFSGVTLAVHFGTWVWSLENTSLAHSLLLVSTTPIILVVFALIMRHAISAGEILGAVFAVVGVAVLAGGAAAGKEAEVTLPGDLSAIAAAVAVALHWHAGKYLRTYQPVFVYSAPVTAIAAGMLMLTGFILEEHSLVGGNRHGIFGWTHSARYAPFVVYLGAVPGIVGHQGFNTVLKYMAPLMVSLAVQFEPVVGPLIGWAVGVSLPPGIYTWIGGAIVLLAAVGATVATARRQEQEEQQCKHSPMQIPTQDLDDFELDIDSLEAGVVRTCHSSEQLGPSAANCTNGTTPHMPKDLELQKRDTSSQPAHSGKPGSGSNHEAKFSVGGDEDSDLFVNLDLHSDSSRPTVRSSNGVLTGVQSNSITAAGAAEANGSVRSGAVHDSAVSDQDKLLPPGADSQRQQSS